jgi:hypothetical protein
MAMSVIRILTTASLLGATPVTAMARQSVLSKADSRKIVCVSARNAVGALTTEKVCMTGGQWEVALREERRRRLDNAGYESKALRNQALSRPFAYQVGVRTRPYPKPF